MTLEEAVKHAEEVMVENLEKTKDRNASDPIAINCFECADEHRQLAEWLKELKAYKEQDSDAISRQAVLEGLRTCYDTETKEYSDGSQWINYEDAVAEMENLPSVTPQPCEDAISRREALNAITMAEVRWQAVDNVNKLPSVTPQQKIGRWIPLEYNGYADGNPVWDKWECSKCGWEHSGDKESLTAFCSNCGAKMEVEE